MGARCKTCGFPVEDHPANFGPDTIMCSATHWQIASLQKQLDQMGLHIQAMKISVKERQLPEKPKSYYLACPYSSPKDSVRWMRQELASNVAASFMSKDIVVFSPITHGHFISAHLPDQIAHDHEFWMRQCLPLVEWADVFCLLPLKGWRESRGIQRELELARSLSKPIIVVQLLGIPSCELIQPESLEALFGPSTLLEIV